MGRDNQSHQSWLRHHIDSLQEHIDNFGQILSTLSNELEVAKDSQHLNSKSVLIPYYKTTIENQKKALERLESLKQQAVDHLERLEKSRR
ncbi:hypothetical protein ACFQ4C_29400 [Larkinella insperata]|uniref:Uncharacterized protein n=1 Tax=Larkinella insperata TaxID=332158 RepID=A0ABW3QEC3_9BACT|nr:hypothetical protein [Larkinella insperata]